MDPETKKWSPFDRDSDVTLVSEEDMEYLRGEPAPLKITIPIVIEKEDEQDPEGSDR